MIIITTPVHPIIFDSLSEKGLQYKHLPHANYNELLEQITEATGLIVATQITIDKRMIDSATNLKWIGRLGSGMEHIDVAYANAKNIHCISSPEGNRTAVAEHALGMLLCLMRNISKSNNEVKKRIWLREENRGIELNGKTVGIIGFGNTGSAFARLLSAFNVTVLAHDKYKQGFGNEYIIESTVEAITQRADVISFHLPLTNETKHLANDAFFKKLQKKPYIINTSRGSIIDTKKLREAIENDSIKGAALDVLENEKLSSYSEIENDDFNFLSSSENVLLTPHIGGYSFEASFQLSNVLLKKIEPFLK